MKRAKIILAGGTGFIGQSLIRYFGKAHSIVVLTRQNSERNNRYDHKTESPEGFDTRYVYWDGRSQGEWTRELEGADLLINLAGKSVNCRYHREARAAIVASRVEATHVLGEAIRSCVKPPRVWINAASATIYRHSLERPNNESSGLISEKRSDNMPANVVDRIRQLRNRWLQAWHSRSEPPLDQDFSVYVCRKWEEAFEAESAGDTRKIILRMGIVLGPGGVLTPLRRLCRLGLGGPQGNGRQLFSWIHETDLARMIEWLWSSNKEGIYNCVAPGAISNAGLMQAMRRSVHCRFGLPAPAWLLELGAWMIRTETELILKSRWVVPGRALEEGFTFRYATIPDALTAISNKG